MKQVFLVSAYLTILILAVFTTGQMSAEEARIACLYSVGETTYKAELPDAQSRSFVGQWVKPKRWVRDHSMSLGGGIRPSKDAFFIDSNISELIYACYRRIGQRITRDSLYFISLDDIRAFRKGDERCTGHEVVTVSEKKMRLVYKDRSKVLRQKLKDYNFGVVLDGMIYRSGKLGRAGMRQVIKILEDDDQPPPMSIASIHVMGFGGSGGTYNLEELEESQARGITFLHSYHPDPKLTVYMDGTDPSKIVEDDPHHGNIYDPKTVAKFLPDKKVREKLLIDKSMEKNRIILGDTQDFFQSIENMIDAPWPLLIHCKGGRHKTGMFSLVFEYLAWQSSLDQQYGGNVSVPAYKNRFANWWGGKGSFWNFLFGGPFHVPNFLAPAEANYARHNMSVFRRKNIDFIRGIASGEFLYTDELKERWERIKIKFWTKVSQMPESMTIQKRFRSYTD